MRLVRIGTTLGAAIALVVGVTSAQALWSASVAAPAVNVRSGDLTVTAAWSGTATWTAPFPGQSSGDRVIRVTGGGQGTTLRWTLGVSASFAPAFQAYATLQAWQGACGTGTPITTGTVGSFAPGSIVDVCVRVALAVNAPVQLRGQPMEPAITVSVQQRTS